MKPIKIYGESKTGTTYLQKLLELNTDAEIIPGNPDSPMGWKHGFPQHGDAVYVFIFRGIYEWVKSLKADTIDKRFNGLEAKFGGGENDFWNVWGNPIKCRTAKYYSYLGFARVYDSSLISYEHLRKRPVTIGKLIDYGYEIKDMESGVPVVHDIPSHTYIDTEGRDNPAREELTEQEIAFIDSQKDPTLEQWVDNLTIHG